MDGWLAISVERYKAGNTQGKARGKPQKNERTHLLVVLY